MKTVTATKEENEAALVLVEMGVNLLEIDFTDKLFFHNQNLVSPPHFWNWSSFFF
jgi:hypothetical protein